MSHPRKVIPGNSQLSGTGRGGNVSVTGRVGTGSSTEKERGSRGQFKSTSLPLTASGKVLLSKHPSVLDWLTKSPSVSSQLSVGSSSDTTVTWHGTESGHAGSPILNLALSESAIDDAESAALLSDAEVVMEDSQVLLSSQYDEFISKSDDESAVVSGQAPPDRETFEVEDISDMHSHHHQGLVADDDDYDDDVADRTWQPQDKAASSSTSDEDNEDVMLLSQQQKQHLGSTSQRGGTGSRGRSAAAAKRARVTILQPESTRLESHSGSRSMSSASSSVWQYFVKLPEEGHMTKCKICGKRVSRGKGSNVGTTALHQHMKHHHRAVWDRRGSNVVDQPAAAIGASPSGRLHTVSDSEGSIITSPDATSHSQYTIESGGASSITPPPRHHHHHQQAFRRQQTITELISKRQHFASTHPMAMKLNLLLSKLLVLQSLPFHLVNSAPFIELMACAEPRWKVPSRTYFAAKAVPALHSHVQKCVGQSLSLSVSKKVHASADCWSSNYGQGQYMSVTAHWVNVVPAHLHQPLGQVTPLPPPRLYNVVDSARLSSSASSSSPSTLIPSAPPSYHTCRARRCHAILHLVCLGERKHTGPELLKVIKDEIDSWLLPKQLDIGNIVTDNGSNIVAALRQGGIIHAPCMAHVFNLIVKRFIKSYTDLKDILHMARKLCNHVSHSYTAKNTLLQLQRQNGLPQNRLICDVATRWNSTLHMLDRLYEQRKAIHDFLLIQAEKNTAVCNFTITQWQLMRDTCRLLRPFEEATLFVSREDYCMNDVIPLIHIIEQMLENLAGDMGPMSSPWVDELEEEDEDSAAASGNDDDDDDDDEEEETDTPWQYAVEMEAGSPSRSLSKMAQCMLNCFRSDDRIITIRQRDDYWLASFLDPRYRSKLGAFFSITDRQNKMTYYKEMLCSQLSKAFVTHPPICRRSNKGGPRRSLSSTMAAEERGDSSRSSTSSFGSSMSLSSMMSSFMHPANKESTPSPDHQQDMALHINYQVHSYLECTLPDNIADPLDYWAGKLDMWPQLAEFAIEMLSCPASSVASERVFSAAGAIVTAKRNRLSNKNLERLTFVRMNQAWINDFESPKPDETE